MFVYQLIDLDDGNVLMRKDIFRYDEIHLFDFDSEKWTKDSPLIQSWERWVDFNEESCLQLTEKEALEFIRDHQKVFHIKTAF